MTKEKEKLYKIAVYGSLRVNESNFDYEKLETQEYLGTFETDPIFNMHSLGGYPALTEGGITSVTMDVFEVDEATFKSINLLEGYTSKGDPTNMYEREIIKTPFGDAAYFLYNHDTIGLDLVESGDWSSYLATSGGIQKMYTC